MDKQNPDYKIKPASYPSLFWLGCASVAGFLVYLPMLLQHYIPAYGGVDISGNLIGHDFVNNWTGARMALSGEAAKIFSMAPYMEEMHRILWEQEPFHAFSYPPHILLLIVFLGLLPYFPALAGWIGAGMAVFLTATLPRLPDKRAALLAAALLLSSPAALVNIVLGQNGFFTAALFLGGIYMSERRPVASGILIGLLTVKPQLGILIPVVLLLRRNWKCFAAASLTALALVTLSLCIWGLEPWRNFISVTIPLQVGLITDNKGFYINMMPALYTGALETPHPSVLTRALWLAAHVMAAAWAAFTACRAIHREGINERTVLMLALATMVVPLYSFNYDLAMVAGALVVYALSSKPLTTLEYFVFILVWILPTAIVPMKVGGLLPLPCIVLLAALACLARMASLQPQLAENKNQE